MNPADAQLEAYRRCCLADQGRTEIIEWLLALTLVTTGFHLLLWPQAVDVSHMRAITTHVPSWVMAAVAFLVGVVRLGCCSVRRPDRRIIRARAALAIVGAVIWAEMVIAFALRFQGQTLPPGIEMLTIMQLGGELWLTYRIKQHAAQLRRKGRIR